MALFDFLRRRPKSVLDVLNENPEFRKMQALHKALDDLAYLGLDVDELPGGDGEFGYDADNPIPCRSISGSRRYLDSLRSCEGVKISWERKGSTASTASRQSVDRYAITDFQGYGFDIFISPYHKRNSTRAPGGLILAEGPRAPTLPEHIRQECIKAAFGALFRLSAGDSRFRLDVVDIDLVASDGHPDLCVVSVEALSFEHDPETGDFLDVAADDVHELDMFRLIAPAPSGPSALSRRVVDRIFAESGYIKAGLRSAEAGADLSEIFQTKDIEVDPNDFWVPVQPTRREPSG